MKHLLFILLITLLVACRGDNENMEIDTLVSNSEIIGNWKSESKEQSYISNIEFTQKGDYIFSINGTQLNKGVFKYENNKLYLKIQDATDSSVTYDLSDCTIRGNKLIMKYNDDEYIEFIRN